ncbi:MAG: proton-conducting transporter membrane subunit, partial [Pseudomonadota bacterium]|nr:proton-conducting transporter membrane subunit [Pseudomonadota bacterium]
ANRLITALMLVLGALGVVSGELMAWRARDLTRMLAYSSIGQLGLVFVAFSIPGEAGMLAGLAVALHHLLVKPALFMLADGWGGSLERLTGAARRSPLAGALFVLFALSLIGIPPLPGFWAKLLTVVGLAQQAQPLYWLALAAVLLATVIKVGYLLPLIARLYAQPDSATVSAGHPLRSIAVSTLAGVLLIAAIVRIIPLGEGLDAIAAQAADPAQTVAAVFPGDVFPDGSAK